MADEKEKKPSSAKGTSTELGRSPTEGKEGKKEETEEVEVPKKFEKIVEEIEKMPVVDLAELVKILEKKFGVSAQPQVIQGAAPAPAAEGAPTEEKSIFNITLQQIGTKKIEVIKAVRDITQKGLKESKDLVDAAEKEPQTIKENVKKEEAEEIKKKFEAAGAKIELK